MFYSDTLAETKSNTGIGQATIDVEIRTQLPGGKAEFYEIRKVARPTDGTDVAEIDAPNLSKKGFKAVQDPMYLLWKKYDERPVITFEYVKDGTITPGGDDVFSVRVNYCTDGDKSAVKGQEDVDIPVSKAGFGTLDAELLTKIPAGYKLKTVTSSNILGGTGSATSGKTYVGGEFDKNDSNTKRDVVALIEARTDITAIEAVSTKRAAGDLVGDILYNATIDLATTGASLKASNIAFKLTFGTEQGKACTLIVDADDNVFLDTIVDAGTDAETKGGTVKVTAKKPASNTEIKTAASTDVTVEVYAKMGDITGKIDVATGWTITTSPAKDGKVKVNDTITITATQTTAGDFDFDTKNYTFAVDSGNSAVYEIGTWTTTNGVTADPTATPAKPGVQAVVSVTVTVKEIKADTLIGDLTVANK